MENINGKNLMQMNLRVKPLINDHLLKTMSLQKPHSELPQLAKVYLISVQKPPRICAKNTQQLGSEDSYIRHT